MEFFKTYDNGLKLVIKKIDGLLSVTAGVMVQTGSANENDLNSGISHYIEHMMFKGTKTRSAFDISEQIDRIGAQINAFTGKESTCYYTKSTTEHFEKSMEVLSDIFFNSVFDDEEAAKEKGVIIEEINMYDDTPEDLCIDILAESAYGKVGYGRMILGTEKNVNGFTRQDILDYMDRYYAPNNTVISIAGNVDVDRAISVVDELFASKFGPKKVIERFGGSAPLNGNLNRVKDIEQTHIALSFPSYVRGDDLTDAMSIVNTALGGGMSSRLFQSVREKLGLAYTVYSYVTQYEHAGDIKIYAGVNSKNREKAFEAIKEEIIKFKKEGITQNEFDSAKEQVKSAFIMSQESTSSQMLLYARYAMYFDTVFDFEGKIKEINGIDIGLANEVIGENFDFAKMATATVGRAKKPLA